jgi:hypothetical protein
MLEELSLNVDGVGADVIGAGAHKPRRGMGRDVAGRSGLSWAAGRLKAGKLKGNGMGLLSQSLMQWWKLLPLCHSYGARMY